MPRISRPLKDGGQRTEQDRLIHNPLKLAIRPSPEKRVGRRTTGNTRASERRPGAG